MARLAGVFGLTLLAPLALSLLFFSAPASAFDLPNLRVVVEPGVVGGHISSFHFLSLIKEPDEVAAYFIDHRECLFQVGRASSPDGQDFGQPEVVLTRDPSGVDSAKASFPGVIKAEETYHLVYEAKTCHNLGTIAYAVSDDGLHFTKQGDILGPAGDGAEGYEVGTPSLFYSPGQYVLYYHGHDQSAVRILAATGPDLFNLTRRGVVIDVDSGAWDSGTVGKRSQVIAIGGFYYLFYEGADDNMGASARWGIGLARASNPLGPWEKYDGNPILTNHRYAYGVDGPGVYLDDDGTVYLYFRVADNQTCRAAVTGMGE